MESKFDNADKQILQIMNDIALIKEILFFNKNISDPEGELSDWAKSELEKARSETSTISNENLKAELGL